MSSVKKAVVSCADYEIDRMTEHDLLEVVEIEESCGLSLWGWDGYRSELDRSESIMLVARLPHAESPKGHLIIGFVAARLNGDELHVNNIGVRESSRCLGVGDTLLGEALSIGNTYGTRRSILEVRASNVAAHRLYSRHGFYVVGRRKNYYRNPSEDALVMSADFEA